MQPSVDGGIRDVVELGGGGEITKGVKKVPSESSYFDLFAGVLNRRGGRQGKRNKKCKEHNRRKKRCSTRVPTEEMAPSQSTNA